MDKLFLLLLLPVVIGYVIFKIVTYDWAQWAKDCENMGDDMF